MQVKKQQLEPDMEQQTGISRLYMLSPCLFNLYAEYTTWNARLDELQAGTNTAGRNIKNLRYANDTTLIVESKEELNSLSIRKESEKGGLKLKVQKWHLLPSLNGKYMGKK